jgi:acetylornithine/succinyldiaminopimelate/putrescine aminotransferase
MLYLTKLIQSSYVRTLAACGAILATMPVEAAFAKATDPSTYQDSCQALDVAGATLTAVSEKRWLIKRENRNSDSRHRQCEWKVDLFS